MKFYDIDALQSKCGTDNKYKITALVAARARWLGDKNTVNESPVNEKYLSAALMEIENNELSKEWLEEVERNAASRKTLPRETVGA